MAGTLKKLRFKLAWQGYRVGDEIEPNATLRDWLIARGYCEIVEDGSSVRAKGVNRMAAPTHRRNASAR